MRADAAAQPMSLLSRAAAASLALSILLTNPVEARAVSAADVVEVADATYPIIKQLKPEAFQPFVGKVFDLLLQAKELDKATDAGLDYFNSVPDAKVAAVETSVKAAFEGLDPESCAPVPLPTRATFDKVTAKLLDGADAAKVKTFSDRAAPIVASFKMKGDSVCLPPVEALEKAAVAQADAAGNANGGAGLKFGKQLSKTVGTAPKGPLLSLFTSYDAAKQTLGASREDRARFEKAGKRIEAAVTMAQRQAAGL